MPSVRKNIAANIVGKAIQASLGFVFPPIYVRLLGIESYGLIGFLVSMTAVFSLLDFGLSATLQRELAVVVGGSDPPERVGNLVRTFEMVFWSMTVAVAVGLGVGAPLVTHHWIHANRLSSSQVTTSVRLMGLIVAMQWPVGLYTGGVQATQRQVLANVVLTGVAVAEWAGGAFVLWQINRTVQGLLCWQAIVAFGQIVSLRWLLRRCLPASKLGHFQLSVLKQTGRLSAGLWGVSVLALCLDQMDKLVVSHVLTLTDLGYYTLAGTVSAAMHYLLIPVSTAVFPRLCQYVGTADRPALEAFYHRSCQVVSALLLPAGISIALFSREAMFAWTGSADLAAHTWAVAAILVVGTTLNGLAHIPYALQISYGWTGLALSMNAISVVILVPIVYFLGVTFGAQGAAFGWLIYNVAILTIGVPLMHRRLLPEARHKWVLEDICRPALVASCVLVPVRLLLGHPAQRFEALNLVVLAAATAFAGVALTTPDLRNAALRCVHLAFKRVRATPNL